MPMSPKEAVVLRMLKNKQSLRAIGEEIGMSHESVRLICKKNGWKAQGTARKPMLTFTSACTRCGKAFSYRRKSKPVKAPLYCSRKCWCPLLEISAGCYTCYRTQEELCEGEKLQKSGTYSGTKGKRQRYICSTCAHARYIRYGRYRK